MTVSVALAVMWELYLTDGWMEDSDWPAATTAPLDHKLSGGSSAIMQIHSIVGIIPDIKL